MTSVPSARALPWLACASMVFLGWCGGEDGGGGRAQAADRTLSTSASSNKPAPPEGRPAILISPTPGTKFSSRSATFVWTDTGANQYGLTIQSPSSAPPVDDTVTSATTLTVHDPAHQRRRVHRPASLPLQGEWLTANAYRFTAAGYTAAQSTAASQALVRPDSLAAGARLGRPPAGRQAAAVGRPFAHRSSKSSWQPGPSPRCSIRPRKRPAASDDHAHRPPDVLSRPQHAGRRQHAGQRRQQCSEDLDVRPGAGRLGGRRAARDCARLQRPARSCPMAPCSRSAVRWNGGQGGKSGEVWSASTRTWRTLAGVPADMPRREPMPRTRRWPARTRPGSTAATTTCGCSAPPAAGCSTRGPPPRCTGSTRAAAVPSCRPACAATTPTP